MFNGQRSAMNHRRLSGPVVAAGLLLVGTTMLVVLSLEPGRTAPPVAPATVVVAARPVGGTLAVAARPAQPTPTPSVASRSPAAVSAEWPDDLDLASPPFGDDRLTGAARARRNGDYRGARERYSQALALQPPPDEADRLVVRLGENELAAGAVDDAIALLGPLAGSSAVTPDADRARFLLAVAYERAGQLEASRQTWRTYLSRSPLLAAHGALRLGQLELAAGRDAAAEAAYDRALAGGLAASLRADAWLGRGRARLAQGHADAALGDFRQAFASAWTDSARAQALAYQARAWARAGRPNEAVAALWRLVDEYPDTLAAPAALATLGELGERPGPYATGRVAYYGLRHEEAVSALERYIDENPEGASVAEARWMRGNSLRALGEYAAAVAQYDRLITLHPRFDRLGEARLRRADALLETGQPDLIHAGLASYRAIADDDATQSLAPQVLWDAAHWLEWLARPDEAVQLYREVAARYPRSRYANLALFRAGLLAYRKGDAPTARQVWTFLAEQYPAPFVQSQTRFWLGKVERAAGNEPGALNRFREAAAANPGDYYALRATALLRGGRETVDAAPFSAPRLTTATAAEHAAVHDWLAGWAPRRDPAPDPRLDAAARRGVELLSLGQHEAARAELGDVLTRFWDDPRALVTLAEWLTGLGDDSTAIAAAERVLALSPAANAAVVPAALQRLLYPMAFADLVVAESRRYQLDPLLLFALIRQESWFNPVARSSAAARGLTQFMPATARQVAAALSIEGFTLADLDRPMISIRLGAFYLADRLRGFGQSPALALAAYNAGGGAVVRWLTGNPARDADLFVEEVRYRETEQYVKRIYQHYQIYQRLYRAPSGQEIP